MSRRIKIIFLLLIVCMIIPSESCIEPINPKLNENDSESLLVVAGQISNLEGPFRVRLTTSVPVNVMYYTEPVTNAEVQITDDKGNTFKLEPADDGWYETADKNLKGSPGNTYVLHITTRNGLNYESAPELMQDVPDIDSVYYDEVNRTTFEGGQANVSNWLNIMVDAHDESGILKYWRYEYTETWEVELSGDRVLVDHALPDQPANITWEKVNISEEKKKCWVTMPSGSILVASTASSPVDEIKRFPLLSLGPGEDRLHILYSILVRQSAISRELYDFWKNLMDANENVGGIYDKVPAQVFGNMSCSDGITRCLGYFSASAIKEKRLFIYRSAHQVKTVSAYEECRYFDYFEPSWIPKSYLGTTEGSGTDVYSSASFCTDCRVYGTNIKPPFWK